MEDHVEYAFAPGDALLRILACQIVQVALHLQDRAASQKEELEFYDAVTQAGDLVFQVTPRVGGFLENLPTGGDSPKA